MYNTFTCNVTGVTLSTPIDARRALAVLPSSVGFAGASLLGIFSLARDGHRATERSIWLECHQLMIRCTKSGACS